MKSTRFCFLCIALAMVVLGSSTGCRTLPPPPAQLHTALQPASRGGDWWMPRHEAKNARIREGNVDLIFIGDSITHSWENSGKPVWDKYYAHRNAVNLGFSGDRTQHVLWRLANGNIDGISPKLAVIMIGTNNFKDNSAEEIADGVVAIVRMLREELPKTQILLLAIFPRMEKPSPERDKLIRASELFSKTARNRKVHYLDIGPAFLEPDGTLPKAIMPDFLHPNERGYQIWAESIEAKVAKLMGER